MRHLFLPPEQFEGDTARITGQDHLHLARVLRARVGETVLLLDGRGNAFRAVLVSIEKSETRARLETAVALHTEPPVLVTVAQALGKGDKFEQVIQHGTEAGASEFVPVRAERSVADIPAGKVAERVARWQQIAKSAAEQSGRARVPVVSTPVTLPQLIQQTAGEDKATRLLMLTPEAESNTLYNVLNAVPLPSRLLILIGPEGGWSPTEVSQATAANIARVSLGPRVLRTETAALVALSQIMYHFESPLADERSAG